MRCQNCGSLSISGLLIPASISLSKLSIPTGRTEGSSFCPLCKKLLDERSQGLTDAICAALREAQLDRAESQVLLNLIVDHYKRSSTQPEILNDLQARVPKASALRRFIPPADVTGVLLLIIAIISFTDDFVVNWIRPQIVDPVGGKDEHRIRTSGTFGWIEISSSTLHRQLSDQHELHEKIYALTGGWGTSRGGKLILLEVGDLRYESYGQNYFGRQVSRSPGPWDASVDATFARPTAMYFLYIEANTRDRELILTSYPGAVLHHRKTYRYKRLGLYKARQMSMLPFRLVAASESTVSIKIETIGSAVNWFNRNILH